MAQVSLGCDLSAESLHVGGYLVCVLFQVPHDTDDDPGSQDNHESGEQKGVLECIEGFGKRLCGHSDVGDLLKGIECLLRVVDVELYQFLRRGIAR